MAFVLHNKADLGVRLNFYYRICLVSVSKAQLLNLGNKTKRKVDAVQENGF